MADPVPILKSNLIRFVSDDEQSVQMFLKVDGDWTLEAGMQPSVFAAVVPYTEFDKLGKQLDRRGRLELFYENSPAGEEAPGETAADVTINGVRLIDVKAERFGRVILADGTKADRYYEYRLAFADARYGLGRLQGLEWGELNKEPWDRSGILDANVKPIKTTLVLIRACLEALGIQNKTTLAHELADAPFARNIEWNGNNAWDELGKLLELAGCVFVAKLDGTFAIERRGKGTLPAPPAGRVAMDVEYPGVEGRGREVIYVSYPNPILRKYELSAGPAGDGDFEFVMEDFVPEDPNNAAAGRVLKWVPLEQSEHLKGTGKSLKEIARDNFQAIAAEHRGRFESYFCRAIRLKPEKHGTHPASLRYTFSRESRFPNILASASTLVMDGSGWRQGKDVALPVHAVLDEGQVLILGQPAVEIEGTSSPDFWSKFEQPGKVKITGTRELHEKDANGEWRPTYFRIGWKVDVGGRLVRLEEGEIKLLLAAGKVRVLAADELQAYQDAKGELTNDKALADRSSQLASAYIGQSGLPARETKVAGYYAAQPSGLIPAVTWSQRELLTSWKANTWYFPHDRGLRPREDAGFFNTKAGRGAKFPGQAQTSDMRTAAGSAGATQPSVLMEPMPMPRTPALEVSVVVGDRWNATDGKLEYGLATLKGPISIKQDDTGQDEITWVPYGTYKDCEEEEA